MYNNNLVNTLFTIFSKIQFCDIDFVMKIYYKLNLNLE